MTGAGRLGAWASVWALGLAAGACDGAEAAPAQAADAAALADVARGADAPAGDVAADPCADEAGVRPILAEHCTSCHGGARPSASLDLEAPGVLARLAARTSVHPACRDTALVVLGAPGEGLFMAKLFGTLADCGEPMPPRGTLEPEELQCFARGISAAGER